jgi:tetratricopeptide (TPR) repeat protein
LVAALNGFTDHPAAALGKWRDCARTAIELDPSDYVARACIGDIRALDGDHAGAVAEYELALASAPNHADTLALLAGSFALCAGDPRRGVELARRAVDLNPGAPPWYFLMLGRAASVEGSWREAVAALRRAPQDAPATLMFLAMAHAGLGDAEEAARAVGRIRREFPSFAPDEFIRGYPAANPPALAAIRAGLVAAGLPASRGEPPDAPCAAPASW